ncbi:hypothetical protein SAMN05216226_10937 [Halovenus aranensis]|jgi:membrane protease YdiL (CAAX protease family)|uniref:CAAX prenyl protease 2/Lysostaphin resistance protein A-like domain-containing protein n=1 Tax=Halovenus aranensis TaxID=890420 RepID=A0A1G8WIP8_9EURY|nr:CPBP family intramembrane glutamic endopeptidase [Halovenus aranensis]SDJ77933.1 hypothetical protein SAMN05216226_10937 [Halovenus aranensis]
MEPTADDGVPEKRPLVRTADPLQRVENITHALLLVAVAFLVAGIIQSFGLSVLDGAGLTEANAPVLTQIVPMGLHFVGFFVVAGAYLRWDDGALVRAVRPTWHDIRWILLGFSLLVAFMVGLDVVLAQLGLEPAENATVDIGKDNPQLFLYFVPLVVFLNAPAEELLFRGVVQGLFRRAYGVIPGILGAALVFGLVHYVALVGAGSRLAYVAVAFVSGLVLGGVHEYTENLTVPIAVHACWNVVIYLNLYVGATNIL